MFPRISKFREKNQVRRYLDENINDVRSGLTALCSVVICPGFEFDEQPQPERGQRNQRFGDSFEPDFNKRAEQLDVGQYGAGMPERKQRQLHAD
jgi:hypothetical protein